MGTFLKSAAGAVMALAALGAAAAASAQAQTFTPSDKDMDDLDHHSAYTWRIDGVDLTGLTVTGATLEFDNIKNWNSGDNRLYLHLLDTARKPGLASFYDDNPANPNVTDLTDDFVNSRYHNRRNGKDMGGVTRPWLVAPGTRDTFLAAPKFGTKPTDYVYDFGKEGKLDLLTEYFKKGNDIAFGLDPDCHFFNDGVKFTMKTTPTTSSAVPEPGTYSLLASGLLPLAGLLRRHCRRCCRKA